MSKSNLPWDANGNVNRHYRPVYVKTVDAANAEVPHYKQNPTPPGLQSTLTNPYDPKSTRVGGVNWPGQLPEATGAKPTITERVMGGAPDKPVNAYDHSRPVRDVGGGDMGAALAAAKADRFPRDVGESMARSIHYPDQRRVPVRLSEGALLERTFPQEKPHVAQHAAGNNGEQAGEAPKKAAPRQRTRKPRAKPE